MKKLLAVMAAVLTVTTFTFASTHDAEARRGGRFVAGLALGLAGAAIIGSHRRYYDDGYYDYGRPRYYGYYPSYYGYGYYPRRHWRHRHHYYRPYW